MNQDVSHDRRLGRRWRTFLVAVMLLGAAGCASSPDETGESGEEAAVQGTAPGDQQAAEGTGEDPGAASSEGQSKSGDPQADEASDSADDSAIDEGQTASSEESEPAKQRSDSGASGSGMSAESAEKSIERAVEMASKGNFSRAQRNLREMSDHPDKGYLAAYNLGVVYEKQGDMRRAAQRYGQALAKKGAFTPALINLIRLYLRQDQIDDADRIARKFIDKYPEDMDHRAARLEVLLAKGQYQDVIQKAKSILRRDERNVEAMVAMATANYWMDRYELARAILGRASDLAPERADIYFLFGLIAMENEETSKAIANFEKAISLAPRFPEAHNNLGLLYYEASDYKGAADQFSQAIDAFPKFREAHLNLGNAYKNLGKFKQAEEAFKKVIELDSDYADAYFNLGILYLDSEIPNMKTIPRLKKAIERLNDYKRVSRGQLDQDDPADKYIKSARKKIESERQRQQMMRQMQKQGGQQQGGGGGNNAGQQDTNQQNGSDQQQNGGQ